MKITPDSNSIYYNTLHENKNNQVNCVDSSSNVKSFDEILIQKGQAIPEKTFIRNLKNEIMDDVKASHSEKELEELKLQIQEGSYQIGIDELIRKILL